MYSGYLYFLKRYIHLIFLLTRDIRETLAPVHSYLKDAVINVQVLPVATT